MFLGNHQPRNLYGQPCITISMWCKDLGKDVYIAICFESDCAYSSICQIFNERENFEESVNQAILSGNNEKKILGIDHHVEVE